MRHVSRVDDVAPHPPPQPTNSVGIFPGPNKKSLLIWTHGCMLDNQSVHSKKVSVYVGVFLHSPLQLNQQ